MTFRNKFLLIPAFIFSLSAIPAGALEKPVAGWSEQVRLFPGGILVNTKLDTGANTSSLNVAEHQTYTKNGATWIKFEFTNGVGKKAIIDRPLVRVARVKDLGAPTQERPVITVGICLGNIKEEVEVTLFDRSGFNFQLLLGRKFLADRVVVDASKRRLLRPQCKEGPAL